MRAAELTMVRTFAVHLENVEALGAGTLAYDQASGTVLPHIHVSVGLKAHSATAVRATQTCTTYPC